MKPPLAGLIVTVNDTERTFEAFHTGHYRQIVAYCVADLRDWAEAEEVAADALVVLWRNWPRLRAHDDHTLKAYVFAVARRRPLRLAPTLRRRPPTVPLGWGTDDQEHDPALVDPASQDDTPEAVGTRLAHRLHDVLGKLDADERAVVLRRYGDGRPLAEVAGEIGTTDGMANVLLRRTFRPQGAIGWSRSPTNRLTESRSLVQTMPSSGGIGAVMTAPTGWRATARATSRQLQL